MKKWLLWLTALILSLGMISGAAAEAATEDHGFVITKWKKLDALYQQIEDAGVPEKVDISNQTINRKDLLALKEQYPNTEFYYRLLIGKRKLLCDTTELDLGYIEFDGMQDLLDYLALMPKVTYVKNLGTVFSADDMALFTQTYPDMTYLFKLRFAHYTVRTDITAFCTKHALYTKNRHTEDDFAALQYCRDLKALDFGHNAATSLEFLRKLPKLQILICVDNQITDLTPLESQTDLEYLEVFLNPGITDISVMSKLTKLIDLHISHCNISDITALYGLTHLDRLWLAQNQIPQEQIDHMQELLPNCTINNTVDQHPTAEGWRQGHPRYLKIREMFANNRYVTFP
ncbi:MAG: hypothetical protein PHI98_08860 [Eubacteriales bacterium]|nr:hypothetical protein [Eubacteriales bacterium]